MNSSLFTFNITLCISIAMQLYAWLYMVDAQIYYPRYIYMVEGN